MISVKISHIANLEIKGSDYCWIISLISKNEAIELFDYLTEKSGIL